uniref:RING-type domain-containing protein n=1 Tax=Neogobius melanostomus TaxID=47308 RepID=A0A8C6SLJ9_9GOBI
LDMSAVLFTEEQLLCSICLEVFMEPVSTPCGHNFCKSCISTHWHSTVGATRPASACSALSRSTRTTRWSP